MNPLAAMTQLQGCSITDVNKFPDLAENGWLYIDDHIGTGGKDLYAMDHLKKLIKDSLKDYKIVIDYLECNSLKDVQYNILMIPVWATVSSTHISQHIPYTKCQLKNSIFNFSINKDRDNRSELLRMLNDLNLYTKTYSFCGATTVGNYKPHYWGDKQSVNQSFVDNFINNTQNYQVYNEFLRENVFEPSYISIITEPEWFRNDCTITEKTLFAFEAQTLPIWFGGYNIPHHLKLIGFDIFDDIIDHSYQNLLDPYDRMHQSILKNLHLFKEIKYLEEFYINNIKRFEYNRNILRNNIISKFSNQQIDKFLHWPEHIKEGAKNIYKKWTLSGPDWSNLF